MISVLLDASSPYEGVSDWFVQGSSGGSIISVMAILSVAAQLVAGAIVLTVLLIKRKKRLEAKKLEETIKNE